MWLEHPARSGGRRLHIIHILVTHEAVQQAGLPDGRVAKQDNPRIPPLHPLPAPSKLTDCTKFNALGQFSTAGMAMLLPNLPGSDIPNQVPIYIIQSALMSLCQPLCPCIQTQNIKEK
jgi:hypothetical protein